MEWNGQWNEYLFPKNIRSKSNRDTFNKWGDSLYPENATFIFSLRLRTMYKLYCSGTMRSGCLWWSLCVCVVGLEKSRIYIRHYISIILTCPPLPGVLFLRFHHTSVTHLDNDTVYLYLQHTSFVKMIQYRILCLQ